MQLIKNRRGFGTIELLLIVVITSMIGGVGYYVYQAKTITDNTYTKASNVLTDGKPTFNKTTASPTNAIPLKPNNSTPPSNSKPPQSITPPPVTNTATVTGKVAGHVYESCGGPDSGCHSQTGVAGDIITVKDGSGKIVATQTTDNYGFYSITAPTGIYSLLESVHGSSSSVEIRANSTTVVNF